MIEVTPKYPDAMSFTKALGSALSLFMGISFITLLEIVEILLDTVRTLMT